MSREYTTKLIEMIDEGLLDRKTVLTACLNYMSEDEVKEMMETNEFVDNETDDDDSEND